MSDPNFHVAKLPKGLDRRGFRWKDFDAERFNALERIVYGSPPALKATVGGAAGVGMGLGRYAAEDDLMN